VSMVSTYCEKSLENFREKYKEKYIKY